MAICCPNAYRRSVAVLKIPTDDGGGKKGSLFDRIDRNIGYQSLMLLCGDMRASGDTVTPTRREVVYQIGQQLNGQSHQRKGEERSSERDSHSQRRVGKYP